MKRLLFAVTLTLAACGDAITDDPGNKTTTEVTYDAQKPCGDTNKCPSGQFCWNGICVIGCNTNNECASDQYCDTFWKQCANKTVTTCPETPCAASQTCVAGVCTAKEQPKKQCNPESINDGCANDAFCMQESETADPSCFTVQRCGEDGSCPVGLDGATCNENYITTKGRVCLPGVCKTAANCPANWKCVRFNSADVLGFCSSGGLLSLCTKADECQPSLYCPVDPVVGFGTCSNGAFGSRCSTKEQCQADLDCHGAMPGMSLGSCGPEF